MRRKKNTFCLLFILFSGLSVSFPAFADRYEFTIDLSEAGVLENEDLSLTFNEGSPAAFRITGASITTGTQEFMWTHSGCGVSIPNRETVPVWKMVGVYNGLTGYEDGSTWLDVTVTGDALLETVEISGTGTTGSAHVFTVGYSTETDGSEYGNGDLVGFVSGTCTTYSAISPSGKEIKSIRMVSSDNFAGINYNGASGGINIKSLKVGVSYLQTGVESTQEKSFCLISSTKGISSNMPCRMEIYTLSGILLKQAGSTTFLSTEELPEGFYIVKAVEPGGKKLVKKVTR